MTKLKENLRLLLNGNEESIKYIEEHIKNDEDLEVLKFCKENNDNAHTQYIRGLINIKGHRVEINICNAIIYFEKSYKGNKYSGYELGKYHKKKGDYDESYKYYYESAKLGNKESQYEVGLALYNLKKYRDSVKWLIKIYEKGYSQTNMLLKKIFDNNLEELMNEDIKHKEESDEYFLEYYESVIDENGVIKGNMLELKHIYEELKDREKLLELEIDYIDEYIKTKEEDGLQELEENILYTIGLLCEYGITKIALEEKMNGYNDILHNIEKNTYTDWRLSEYNEMKYKMEEHNEKEKEFEEEMYEYNNNLTNLKEIECVPKHIKEEVRHKFKNVKGEYDTIVKEIENAKVILSKLESDGEDELERKIDCLKKYNENKKELLIKIKTVPFGTIYEEAKGNFTKNTLKY